MTIPHWSTDPRGFLTGLFDAAVARSDPMQVVAPHLPPRPKGRLIVIGAGKASARMAEAVEAAMGPCEGMVITRYGYARPCDGIEIIEAAHPVPDAAGVEATQAMLSRVGDLGPDDMVLALISGGGSALLCAPVEGVSLADKQALNAALLASGAPIGVMNRIRKQLSAVKGGHLAAACAPARLLTLVISDVPGDAPSDIASGPTVGDPMAEASIAPLLEQWGITLPEHVRAAMARAPGPLGEDDPRLSHAQTKVIAAPSEALASASALARAQGVTVRMLGDALEGEARDVAAQQAALAQQIARDLRAGDAPVLLLSGGECTVTRTGQGVGGPNAEFALAAAVALRGDAQVHVLSCDTDGVDGAAEVAGAYCAPDIWERAGDGAMRSALLDNDAHSFFAAHDGQVITGPTLTNVNDFRAVLIVPPVS